MFKKYLLLSCVFLTVSLGPVVFASEDCVPAVDMADAMNLNQKPCDYSDKGLNGVLHKAFGKKSTVDTEAAAVMSQSVDDDKSSSFLLRAQTDQWANVQLAKIQLLPQALAQCKNGFRITAEEYRPLKMGKVELSLECVCL